MSYERQNSTTRLEQYRARQAERIEAMSRAIDEGRTTVVSSAEPAKEAPSHLTHLFASKQIPVKLPQVNPEPKSPDGLVWVGSRKSVAALSVEALCRQQLRVTVAAPIRRDGSIVGPRDGQLFAYDAKTKQMIPVEAQSNIDIRHRRLIKRARQTKQKGQPIVTGNSVVPRSK